MSLFKVREVLGENEVFSDMLSICFVFPFGRVFYASQGLYVLFRKGVVDLSYLRGVFYDLVCEAVGEDAFRDL